MNFVLNLLLVVQILSALGMIGLILIQHGKGADMGAAFGSGASGSLFGASGSANFLSRATAGLAVVFFVATLALAYFGFSVRTAPSSGSVLDKPAAMAPAAGSSTPVAVASAGAAAAIPVGASPAAAASAAAAAPPSVPASGAAQIPSK